jgi:uncharacterized coiled-coil protein SlyX
MEQRMVDLEIRYTHLEHQVDELSQVVYAQQQLLEKMSRDLDALRSRQSTLGGEVPEDPPPHY